MLNCRPTIIVYISCIYRVAKIGIVYLSIYTIRNVFVYRVPNSVSDIQKNAIVFTCTCIAAYLWMTILFRIVHVQYILLYNNYNVGQARSQRGTRGNCPPPHFIFAPNRVGLSFRIFVCIHLLCKINVRCTVHVVKSLILLTF